jgi:hypothetical protein
LLQGTPQSWPATVIQDSVAAIVGQRVYQRSVRATLFERLMEWLGDLLRRIFSGLSEIPHFKWVVLSLTVVVVLAIAARLWLGTESEERRRRARTGSIRGTGDPWVEAERLATAGDYTEAAHLLYRGLIERLAAGEQIRLHPSKTSGDYARELQRRGSAVHGDFRQFGRRYDHVLFGTGTCDESTYAALRAHAHRVTRSEARAA